MERLFVETVKYGVVDPMMGTVMAEMKVRKGDETIYVSLVEADGGANFYKTSTELYEAEMNCSMDEDELDILEEGCIDSGEYYELKERIHEEDFDLFRALEYLVRAGWDESEELKNNLEGRYLDEVDVPKFIDEDEEYDEEEEE